MGPCFVYMGWALTVVIFLPIFIYGIRNKRWLMRIVGGIPLAFVLIAIAGTILQVQLSKYPDYAFKKAFGKLPENNIKVIDHDYRFSTDSLSIYIKVEANREDFEKILQKGFQKTNKDRIKQAFSYTDTPSWFKPIIEGAREFYEMCPYKEVYASSEAYLSYNEKNRIAYFYGCGID